MTAAVDKSNYRSGTTRIDDGSGKRTHATFPYADEVVVSPDGSRVACQEGDNVFVAPLPGVVIIGMRLPPCFVVVTHRGEVW